jgi:hypothetical protein
VSDPLAALDQFGQRETRGLWTNRLIWFLRAMAAVSMIKGLYHWAVFPQIFGGRIIMVLAELAAIFAYVWLTLMAARERPP